MTIFALRIFIFTILHLAIAGAIILIDRTATTRERRLEVQLIFLFALGVAGSGIGNFIGHFLFSDVVADSIG